MRPPAPLVVVTDRHQAGPRGVAAVAAAAVAGGARWVLLRDRDLAPGPRAVLLAELEAIVGAAGGVVSVAGVGADTGGGGGAGPAVAGAAGGSTGGRPCHLGAREAVPPARPALLGRSCHDPAGLARARAEGCDYAFVSPVFATASKPGYGPVLGGATLAAWCRAAAPLPVYALGGVDAATAGPCRAAGAAGVAVMGAVMRAPRPDEVVASLLAALGAPAPAAGPWR